MPCHFASIWREKAVAQAQRELARVDRLLIQAALGQLPEQVARRQRAQVRQELRALGLEPQVQPGRPLVRLLARLDR